MNYCSHLKNLSYSEKKGVEQIVLNKKGYDSCKVLNTFIKYQGHLKVYNVEDIYVS